MSKVYQCDRCKTIFEPRVLDYGEPYITRKGKVDIDLCPKCYELLKDFLSNYDLECKVLIDGKQIYPQKASEVQK